LAQNRVGFSKASPLMMIHDHELAGSPFSHQSPELGVKRHRRLIGVDCRLERDRGFVRIRTKNNLESPRSAVPHGLSSCSSFSVVAGVRLLAVLVRKSWTHGARRTTRLPAWHILEAHQARQCYANKPVTRSVC
jgi:hypothetical protein